MVFHTDVEKLWIQTHFSTHKQETHKVFHTFMCTTLWITVENILKTVENQVDTQSFPLFRVEKYVDFHQVIHTMRKTKKEL